jgi:uncharacterized small protein (DUF1192 family)
METKRWVNICSRLKVWIERGRAEIKSKEGLIADLQTRIKVLQAEPTPDLSTIHGLEARVAALQAELNNDRLQQEAMEEEYLAECS